MSFKPITVTQLNTYVKQIFDAEELLHGISVVGEISGWSIARGTAYFTLKDEGSALSCVCFTADKFSHFKNGDSVMLVGSVTYYTKTGRLNFNAYKIEAYGQSVLYQQFLELKEKLQNLGYFAQENKIELPKEINRIGVVSSETGAVIQDIINVSSRRNPKVNIVLYPVKVQGVGAENEIAKGIEFLDNYNVDVIVVARGGGSFEDLAPFNTEIVATATYNCQKPIVSAVGHETDYTIIDFCSDLRAPTPSAAAELLCPDVSARKGKYYAMCKSFLNSMQRFFQYKVDILNVNAENLLKDFSYLQENVNLTFNKNLQTFNKTIKSYIDNKQTYLERKSEILNKLDPKAVLKLGYAFLKKQNMYINSIKDVKPKDNLEIQLKDGSVIASVLEIKDNIWILKKQLKN